MTSNHHWHTKNVFSNNPLSILIIKTPDRERVKRSSYQENQISIRIDQVVQSTRVGWKWVSERRREKTYNCLFCIYWNQELREREMPNGHFELKEEGFPLKEWGDWKNKRMPLSQPVHSWFMSATMGPSQTNTFNFCKFKKNNNKNI